MTILLPSARRQHYFLGHELSESISDGFPHFVAAHESLPFTLLDNIWCADTIIEDFFYRLLEKVCFFRSARACIVVEYD